MEEPVALVRGRGKGNGAALGALQSSPGPRNRREGGASAEAAGAAWEKGRMFFLANDGAPKNRRGNFRGLDGGGGGAATGRQRGRGGAGGSGSGSGSGSEKRQTHGPALSHKRQGSQARRHSEVFEVATASPCSSLRRFPRCKYIRWPLGSEHRLQLHLQSTAAWSGQTLKSPRRARTASGAPPFPPPWRLPGDVGGAHRGRGLYGSPGVAHRCAAVPGTSPLV